MSKPYPLEDIRGWLVRRTFLVGDVRLGSRYFLLLSPEEYAQLKERTLRLPAREQDRIRAFIAGWEARGG